MIKPEQIPDEVGYVASNALHSYPELWDFKVAIAAAINAWPHSHYVNHHEWMKTGELASFDVVLPVILPLSQEKNDD